MDYELSPVQQSFLVLDLLQNSRGAMNLAFAYRIQGKLNIELLENAFFKICCRHEMLRTVFVRNGNCIFNHIADNFDLNIEVVQCIGSSPEEKVEYAIEKAEEESLKPMQPFRTLMYKVFLYEISTEDFLLLINMHHTVSDGWSNSVIFHDICQYYNNPELPVQIVPSYEDYLNECDASIHDDYWKEELKGAKDILLNRSGMLENPIEVKYLEIKDELYRKILLLEKKYHISIVHVLATAIHLFLTFEYKRNDTMISIASANRSMKYLETVGPFAGAIRSRLILEDEMLLETALKVVRSKITKGQKHSFGNIKNIISSESNSLKNKLNFNQLEIMLAYQNFKQIKVNLGEAEVIPYFFKRKVPLYGYMWINAVEFDERIECMINFDSSLYSSLYIEKFTKNVQNILTLMSTNHTMSLKELREEFEHDNN